jgi:hypothetical protein
MDSKIQLVPTNSSGEKKNYSNNYNNYKQSYQYQYTPKYQTKQYGGSYQSYYPQQYMYNPYYNPAMMVPPINITFQQAENHVFMNDFPKAENYDSFESIAKTFPHLKDINNANFDIESIKECKCFILRSNNEDDVHKAIKYRVWTSTQAMNERLRLTWEECKNKDIPIFLFYSVMKSGQFVGVAKLKSGQIEEDFEYWWEPGRWRQKFNIDWVFVKDIPFSNFEELRNRDGFSVTRAKDGTQIPVQETKQMLQIFKDKKSTKNIFSAFHYMDVREDFMRFYRNPSKFYQQNQNNMNMNSQPWDNYSGSGYMKKSDTTFKYNTFPNPNDNKGNAGGKGDFGNKVGTGNGNIGGSQEGKMKQDEAKHVSELLTEFESVLKVCEKTKDEMVKKLKTSTDLANKLHQSPSETEDITKRTSEENRYLKTQEKELVEVIGELESKSQQIEKALSEIQNKNNGKSSVNGSTNGNQDTVSQKRNEYERDMARFNKFKEDFQNDKKLLQEFYVKLEELNIR